MVFAAACKDSAWTPIGSAELVLSEIKRDGVASVAKRVDSDESFGRAVMKGIATGDSAWLEVASRLTPASATAEASLSIALASALPRSPARVLSLIGEKYPLEEVCGIPFLRPDSALVTSYHDDAIAALARVRDTLLTKPRDACRAALDTARSDKLARINPAYIVKNKPVPPPPRPKKRPANPPQPVTPPVTAPPPVTPPDSSSSGTFSENHFGWNVGAGISMPLSGFDTFLEARYNRVVISNGTGTVAFIPIVFGIMF